MVNLTENQKTSTHRALRNTEAKLRSADSRGRLSLHIRFELLFLNFYCIRQIHVRVAADFDGLRVACVGGNDFGL